MLQQVCRANRIKKYCQTHQFCQPDLVGGNPLAGRRDPLRQLIPEGRLYGWWLLTLQKGKRSMEEHDAAQLSGCSVVLVPYTSS